MTRLLLVAQGLYYMLAGLWPLVSMGTFEALTGPKVDDWLVQTVGALALAIGMAILFGARAISPERETLALAALAAVAFAAVDLVFAGSGRISRIYLADAAAEIVFLVGALRALKSGRREGRKG